MDPNGLALDAFLLEDGELRYETLGPRGRSTDGQGATVTSCESRSVAPLARRWP